MSRPYNVGHSEREPDVLILGGGVVGLACAHYLLQAGRSVRVLERGRVGGATSHGNCGTITPSHAAPLAMPGMVMKALKYLRQADAPFRVAPRFDPALFSWLLHFARRCNWTTFEAVTRGQGRRCCCARGRCLASLVREEGLQCGFEELGTLYCWRDPRAFEQAAWLPRALAAVGIEIRALDGAVARAMEPALQRQRGRQRFHNPGDAHLRPDRYLAELARRVRELGGEIVEGAAVTGLLRRWRPHRRRCGRRAPLVRARRGVRAGRLVARGSPRGSACSCRSSPARATRSPTTGPRSRHAFRWSARSAASASPPGASGFRLGSTMEFAGYDESLNRRAPRRAERVAPASTCASRKVRGGWRNGTAGGR